MIRFEDHSLPQLHNRRSATVTYPASPNVAATPNFPQSPTISGGSKIPNFLTASSSVSVAVAQHQHHQQPQSPGFFGSMAQQPVAPKTPVFPMSPVMMPMSGARARSPSTSMAFPVAATTPGNNAADLSGLFCRRQHSTSGTGMPTSPMLQVPNCEMQAPTSPMTSGVYITPERVEADNWVIVENFTDDARSAIVDRLRRCGDVVKTDFSLTSNRVYARFANVNQARAAITLFGSGGSSRDEKHGLFTVRPMDDIKYVENLLATDGAFDYKRISPVFGQTNLPKQLRFRRSVSVSDDVGVMNVGRPPSAQGQATNGQLQGSSSLRNSRGDAASNPNQQPTDKTADLLFNRFLLFWFGLSDQNTIVAGPETESVGSTENSFDPRVIGLKNFGAIPITRRCRAVKNSTPVVNAGALVVIASFVLILLIWLIFL